MPILWEERIQALQEGLPSSCQHGQVPLHPQHEELPLLQEHWQLHLPEKDLPILQEEVGLPHCFQGLISMKFKIQHL